MSIELKPCPFCGSRAVTVKTSSGINTSSGVFYAQYKVGCTNCNIFFYGDSTGHFMNGQAITTKNGLEELKERWNRRTPNDH